MLHPVMTIRPDEVVRSGIIQPFGVRATSPVAFARHEIDPFIRAIRPMASEYEPAHMDGFGAVTVQRRQLAGLGATGDSGKYLLAGAALGLGLLGGFFMGRMSKKRRRRR